MRKFITFITAVCVLFLIKLQWPKIRTNVFMIHHIISMLHCLDHSVKITTRLECKCLFSYSTCISINFFVVFKILVSSVRNIDSNSVQFIVHNPANGVEWEALKPDFIYRGKRAMELPTKVPPGKINDLLMTANHKNFI